MRMGLDVTRYPRLTSMQEAVWGSAKMRFGRLHLWSGMEAPYRSHLPHPESHQLVAAAEVHLVGPPTNPRDGEHVVAVELVPSDEAVLRLRSVDPFAADLLGAIVEERKTV
jgi:8-oxo-dGTP diphosphatase